MMNMGHGRKKNARLILKVGNNGIARTALTEVGRVKNVILGREVLFAF